MEPTTYRRRGSLSFTEPNTYRRREKPCLAEAETYSGRASYSDPASRFGIRTFGAGIGSGSASRYLDPRADFWVREQISGSACKFLGPLSGTRLRTRGWSQPLSGTRIRTRGGRYLLSRPPLATRGGSRFWCAEYVLGSVRCGGSAPRSLSAPPPAGERSRTRASRLQRRWMGPS